MKIRVVSAKGGRHENITLSEPLTISKGDNLNKLISGDGMEHWFKPDGTYDGWGMDISSANLSSVEQAQALVAAIEKEREFPEPR